MASAQFNEKKFASTFDYQDTDFATNSFKQEERAEKLAQISSDPKNNIDIAVYFLGDEARDFKERFVVRRILRDKWDWPSLDASQRIAYFMRSLEFELVKSDRTGIPFTWEWGAFLLELQAVDVPVLTDGFLANCQECLKIGKFVTRKTGKLRKFSSDQKLLVFALEMQAARHGETIDWDSFGIPADRFWLDCARRGLTEPDPARAAEWVRDLCDAHQASANTKADSGGTDVLEGHEIDERAHFLWPITVHAFMRLRRSMGLPDPAAVDHPLLRTSFAPLLDMTPPLAERWQAEPWFAEIVEICTREIPALADAKKLVL